MPKVTRRKERRKEQRERYLGGASRRPYCHTPSLQTSFSEGSSNDTSLDEIISRETVTQSLCSKCAPVLFQYADIYRQLVHQRTELMKKKKVNPNPKTPGTHYRDVKAQNEWLRENVFDAMGNYLFCCACVRIAFGISKQRIARQRAIKRKQFKEPLRSQLMLKRSALVNVS